MRSLPSCKRRSPSTESLLQSDGAAHILATSRQAFYVAHRNLFQKLTAVFHILDFVDADIRQYAMLSDVDPARFLAAARAADMQGELANPFVLSLLIERFKVIGRLSDRRSEIVDWIIQRLIESRPLINAHRQRRALCMLAVALEVYSRNELSEDEAIQVMRASMRMTESEARQVLDELYGSILKRTGNGLAFQMRSYGEYLAARGTGARENGSRARTGLSGLHDAERKLAKHNQLSR